MALLTVGPTFDQASKQNIGDSEFGILVVRWREQDISRCLDLIYLHYGKGFTNHFMTIEVLNVFTKVLIAKAL